MSSWFVSSMSRIVVDVYVRWLAARAVFERPERLIDRLATIANWAAGEPVRRDVARSIKCSALDRICSPVRPIFCGILHRFRKIRRCRSCIRSNLVWFSSISVIDKCVGESVCAILELARVSAFGRTQTSDLVRQDL